MYEYMAAWTINDDQHLQWLNKQPPISSCWQGTHWTAYKQHNIGENHSVKSKLGQYRNDKMKTYVLWIHQS